MVPYIGEIRMFAGNFAPVGWAFCNGDVISIASNEVLFTLLGTTYGGDGVNTFALPDLRSRIPLHQGVSPRTGTPYTLGQMGGTETQTLTLQELPAHTHGVNAYSSAGNLESPESAVWAQANQRQYSSSLPDITMNGQNISSSGGNLPHDNMMPYLPVSFIIALDGMFPQFT